jgi:hypothetical protein
VTPGGGLMGAILAALIGAIILLASRDHKARPAGDIARLAIG